jgi:hypothetical protein
MCIWCVRENIVHTNPPPPAPGQWKSARPEGAKFREDFGLTSPICWDLMSRRKKEFFSRCDPAYQDDYAKILAVMKDSELVKAKLKALDQSISTKPTDASPETNWLRLSSILSYFEKQCWFHTDVLLPLGILTADDFYFYIRRGYVLKDYGAGVKHGEFTHRLQWHVLMRVITNDFTTPRRKEWDHSPLELYVSLGMKQNHGAWVRLFDERGDGDFNHPDSLHQWVLESDLGNLAGMVRRRETKRREVFIRAVMDYINTQAREFADVAAWYLLSDISPMQSHKAFKEFDRWFAGNILIPKTGSEAEEIYDRKLMTKYNAVYLETKTQVSGKHKHRDRPYQALNVAGPVYSLGGSAIIDQKTADERAKNSSKRLLR